MAGGLVRLITVKHLAIAMKLNLKLKATIKNLQRSILLCLGALLCISTIPTYSGSNLTDLVGTKSADKFNDTDSIHIGSKPTSNKPQTESTDNSSRIEQLKLLQAQTDREKSWYQDTNTLSAIGSVGAVILSILALFTSHRSQTVQQIREKREELREVLERLVSFREESSILNKLKDEAEKTFASGYLNSKRSIYLEAAESIAKQISKYVNASEYHVLGLENHYDSDFAQARMYYILATESQYFQHSSPTTQTAIWRSLAGTHFLQEPAMLDIKQGRKYFERALKVLEGRGDYYSSYLRARAYTEWAYGELSCRDYVQAMTSLNKAYDEWQRIPAWSGIYRGYECRTIANYLRMIGLGYCQTRNMKDGRLAFKKALETLQTLTNKFGINDDGIIDARALIYQEWGQQETNAGFKREGTDHFEQAKKIYVGLSENCAWKNQRVVEIDSLLHIDQRSVDTQNTMEQKQELVE